MDKKRIGLTLSGAMYRASFSISPAEGAALVEHAVRYNTTPKRLLYDIFRRWYVERPGWTPDGVESAALPVTPPDDPYLAVVRRFASEMLVRDPMSLGVNVEMYQAWVRWCMSNEEGPGAQRRFTYALRSIGYVQENGGRRRWLSVRLVGGPSAGAP